MEKIYFSIVRMLEQIPTDTPFHEFSNFVLLHIYNVNLA